MKEFAKSIVDLMFVGDSDLCAGECCLLYDSYTPGDD